MVSTGAITAPTSGEPGYPPPVIDRRFPSRRSFLGALAAFGAAAALRADRAWARAQGPERILEEAHSPYNHIVVGERGSVRTMYFVVENTRYIESRIDLSHPQSLDLDYTRTMMAGFMVHPRPKRLAMIGLGGGQISNYLHARFPDMEIDAVDIDPEVVRIAHEYFRVPKTATYRTHVGDGRLFVEQAKGPEQGGGWDMLLLDAFRGVFVPYHLKTREFYQACLDKLTGEGVVVANLHNATRMYPHDRATLARVFPQRYTFVSESGNQTTFVAGKSERRVGAYEMRRNARSLQSKFDFDLSGLAARYYLHRDWEAGAQVLRDDFKPSDLEAAAARHNTTCIRNCQYQTR